MYVNVHSLFSRIRCGVPVVLMGETGCGKTTLVRFMCALIAGPKTNDSPKNMLLVKVSSYYYIGDIHKPYIYTMITSI